MTILFVDVEAVNETDWNAIGAAVFDEDGFTLEAHEWCRPMPRELYDELRVQFWNNHPAAEHYINTSSRATIEEIPAVLQAMIARHGVTAIATDCPSFDIRMLHGILPSHYLPVICVRTLVNTVKELVNRGVLRAVKPAIAVCSDGSGICHTPLADVARVAASYFWARAAMRSSSLFIVK